VGTRAKKKLDQLEVVEDLLVHVTGKLRGKNAKATLGDYIRLVQLRKELDEDQPREIKVTWVEPPGVMSGEEADQPKETAELQKPTEESGSVE